MINLNDVFNDNLKDYEIAYLTAVLEDAYYKQTLLLEKIIETLKIDDKSTNVSKKDTNKKK